MHIHIEFLTLEMILNNVHVPRWLSRAIGKLPEIFGTLPIAPHLTLKSLEYTQTLAQQSWRDSVRHTESY